jgi:hypothetical protein
MTHEHVSVCEHGIPAHALSAWRDGDLSADEARRIAAHVDTCPASRARLADYATIIDALRAQPVPPAQDRVWQGVRAHIGQIRQTRGDNLPRLGTGGSRRQLVGYLGGIAAVLAVSVLLVGFALTLTHGPAARPSVPSVFSPAPPTATRLPLAVPLTWRSVTAPAGTLAIAPGNGDVAYVCAVSADGAHVSIWVTRDRAAHWSRTAAVPVPAGTTQCLVTVDGLQPAIAVVAVTGVKLGGSPRLTDFASYVTFDGGHTWRALAVSGSLPYLTLQFSTRATVTYAHLRVANGQQEDDVLATSSDHMRTWHPLFHGVSASVGLGAGGLGGTAFWLNPTDGALLVQGTDAFWSSANAGGSWTRLAVPGFGSAAETVVVQAPVGGRPWHLCAANESLDPQNPHPHSLTCSTDGGRTWQILPGLNRTFTNPPKGTFVYPVGVVAIASDGAILAVLIGPPTNVVYRLPADTQQWQSLGPDPGSAFPIAYYPAPGSGVLWALSEQGLLTADYP